MGWRYQVGVTRACKVEDGKILVDSYPKQLEFDTDLPFNIDWQTNIFEGGGICFVLISEERERICIGLETGQIMILTLDGIFAGITQWSVPLLGMDLHQIGYYSGQNGMFATYAGVIDPYWIHTARRSMRLQEPVPRSVLLEDYDDTGMDAWNLSEVIQGTSVLSAGVGEDKLTAGSGEWFEDPPKGKYPWLILGEEV